MTIGEGGGPPNLHPFRTSLTQHLHSQRVADGGSKNGSPFGAKTRTLRSTCDGQERQKPAILLGILEAPPGFEPGMEVLQT